MNVFYVTESSFPQNMVWTKQRINNLFFFLGIAAVVVMLFTFDVSFIELWEHLTRAGYWLVPIVGVWFFIYGVNALSWQCIIRSNCTEEESARVSFWRIFRLTITGYALNYATPVGGLGGEPYRIMELSRDMSKEHATSSVILYAMMHVFAHFWFWFTSIFLYLALAAVGDLPLNTAVGIVLGFIALLFFAALYLFTAGYRYGLVVNIIRWIGKIPGLRKWSCSFSERHAGSLQHIDEQIAALHRQDKKAFYNSLLLEYLSRILQSSEVFFMHILFGIDCGGGVGGLCLTYLHSILVVALTSFLANLIGFLPMQIGVQEGGFVISIAALGLSAALGIFVSIICRVREIIWIIVGIALMKVINEKSPAST